MITLSTVTPVYSGEKYLVSLVDSLQHVREHWEDINAPVQMAECIFVDDGSIDKSKDILMELSQTLPWLKVVTLSRNFGQHSATIAGICHSYGDWVVTLDEDMQHKPENIERMLRLAVEKQADIVYAKPAIKVHGGYWRDTASSGIKKLLSRLTGIKDMPMFNSFRLLRGCVARAAASSSSSQTYFDVALTWFTCSITSLDIPMQDERHISDGSSGYSLLKLIDHARRLIVNSNVDISRWGFIIGIISIVFSILITIWVFFGSLVLPETIQAPGWASLLATIALLSGTVIALLTMILEYVSIVMVNYLGKPVFFTVDRSSDKLLQDWYKERDVSEDSSSR